MDGHRADDRLGFDPGDELDVAHDADPPHERDRGFRRVGERELPCRLGGAAREGLESTNDLCDLRARLLDERDARVQLRAGLGVGERELRASEQREQWVRDLVQGASGEPTQGRQVLGRRSRTSAVICHGSNIPQLR